MTTKTYTCNEQFENETINVTANEELRLEFYAARRNQVEYNIVDDDIVLTVYGYQSYYDVDKSTVYGTVTIKNGAKKETFGETGSLVLYSRDGSENTSDNFYMGDKSTTENQTLKGTFHDEHFTDGFGNDTIETGSGNNIVELGYGGNNTVDLEDSSTTINWMNGSRWSGNLYKDYLVTGGDVIKNADGDDTLVIGYDDTFNTHIEFGKSGNDLVAVYNAQYESGAGKLTVKDYFTAEEKIKMKNSYVTNTMTYDENNNAISLEYEADYYKSRNKKFDIKNYVEGNTTVNGTDNDDIIIANAQSTIKTGKGDDTIYTSSSADTIIVDGDGEKTVVVKASSGDDVIRITNPNTVVNIDLCDAVYNSQVINQSGNDLVISYRAKYFDTEAKEVKQKDASVTVKDFFKKGNEYYVSTRDGYWKEYADVLGREGKTITGNLNKNNTIKGTAFGDTMTGGNKDDKFTTGMGNDSVTTLKGKDAITIDGKGTKTINISAGDGAKTITGVDKSTKTIIQTNFNDNNFSWSQSGKDLVLRNFEPATGKNDTITIKNYYLDKNGTVNPDVSSKLYYKSNSVAFNPESYYQYITGKKITSTSEKTLLAGTAKGDNLTSNYDSDKIYGGKGNDNITLNNGSKTVMYAWGDGNDTISGVKDTTSTNITTLGWGNTPYGSRVDAQVTAWSKSNNDVILHLIDTATMKESKITIKDYDVSTGTLKVNNGSLIHNNSCREYFSGKDITDSEATSNKTVLFGTAKNDKITATKDSWIYAGKGNDEINVNTTSSYVSAGAGNDKIKTQGGGYILAQSGTNEITLENTNPTYVYSGTGKDTFVIGGNTAITYLYFRNDAVATEGNDVIKFSKDKTSGYNTALTFKNTNDKLTYKKSGNDLLISEVVKNAKNKDVVETVTIEDYFNSAHDALKAKLYINNNNSNNVDSVLNQYGLTIPGVANKKTKQTDFTGTKYKDIINGTTKVDNITTGAGNDVITAGKGNDIITIDGGDEKTINLKKGDGNDTIILGEGADYINIVTDADYTPHSKNGDDLLIHRLYMNSDKEVISTEVTTVKDYYKNNNTATVTINGSHLLYNSIYYSGNDVTTVAHGSDYYCVSGTKGADTMNLAGYNDAYAGAGNDTIKADGYSNIWAGNGNDTITTTGTAHIYGGAGNDTITTSCYGEGSCTIYGGAGNDTITATGKAYIEDGAGDDTITVSDLDTNYWSCFGDLQDGEGNDTFNLKTCASLDLNSGKNTVIVDSAGQNKEQTHVYSGAGDDTMIFRGASNSVWFSMANHNVIDEGNDTVIFEGNPTDKVVIQVSGDETYTKKGNDLIITDYHTNAKGKTVSENVTVKDFFIKQAVHNWLYLNGASASDKIAEILSSGNSVNITGVANKKTKQTDFTGSQFNDTVTGTAKVDNIITNAGNDMITAGKGNDIITINGTGTKTINIANGDGKDTVKFIATGATANFVYNQNDAISWSQSGDNLILSRTYDSGSKVLTEQTVVEGYFADGFNNTVKVNGTDFSTETFAELVSGRASKGNKVEITTPQNYVGGSKNDDITINANAEVFAGAGADKITIEGGNATVHTGAGNDTVTVKGGSDIRLVHSSGEGNDTIVFNGTPNSVNLSVDMKISDSEYYSALQSGKLGFVKSGNDLLFSTPNGKKAEIITVKDYFANGSKKPANFNANLFMSGQGIGSLSLNELMTYWGLGIAGVTDKNKITTFEGTDNLMNTMNARGKNKAKMYGGYSRDIYTTDLNKNSQIYIKDKDVFKDENGNEVLNYRDAIEDEYSYTESNDNLIMNAKRSDVRMFFNVSNAASDFYDYTNIIITDDTFDFDSMVLFDKKSFTLDNLRNVLSGNGKTTGCIQIDDFFARQKTVGESEVLQTPTDFRGEGYIEHFYTGKGMYDTNMDDIYQDEWMRNIKYDVAQWFASDGISTKGYTSVIDVINKGIESGDMTDAKAVLALYQNSDYTQIVM